MNLSYIIDLGNGYKLSRVDEPLAHSYEYHCEFGVIGPNGKLTYDTPLTDDVFVCINENDEGEFLRKAFQWAREHRHDR